MYYTMKKFISIISCLAIMLSSVLLPVYAYNDNNFTTELFQTSSSNNTLGRTQDEYMKNAEDAISKSSSDDQAIQVVCETFLTLAKASVRNSLAYDCTKMISSDSLDNDTIKYRLSEYAYHSERRKFLGWDIVRDALNFNNFKVSYADDVATASIVEEYSYYANDGFNSDSFRVKEYTFTLAKDSDGWKITSIKTNDPYELEDGFNYSPIDIPKAIGVLKAEIDSQSSKTEAEIIAAVARDDENAIKKSDASNANSIASTLYHWTYSPSSAVLYATQYYKSINPLFGEVSADCQNFASQCVWAGFGGASTITAIPAVSTSLVGSSSSRVWCKGQSTTYYTEWYYNWAWTRCESFAKLIDTSSYIQQGPLGWVYYGDLLNACAGDVIQYDTGGAPSDSTVDHAMFVTEATGTKGTRTVENIKICAHNDYTSYANQPLGDYIPSYMDSSYFANQRISSAYYSEEQ